MVKCVSTLVDSNRKGSGLRHAGRLAGKPTRLSRCNLPKSSVTSDSYMTVFPLPQQAARCHWIHVVCAAVLWIATGTQAQDWPTRTVRMI